MGTGPAPTQLIRSHSVFCKVSLRVEWGAILVAARGWTELAESSNAVLPKFPFPQTPIPPWLIASMDGATT